MGFSCSMRIFFNNTNTYNTVFQAGVKSPKTISRPKLNVNLTQDTVQLTKKQKISDKQLEKIKEFVKKRPNEVQNVYDTSLKYMNKEIKPSDFVSKLGVSAEQIIEKQIPVYNNEIEFLSDMAEKTDMFFPGAINEEYFNELVNKFLKKIKK